MTPHLSPAAGKRKTRRDLLRHYMRLQRELVEGDPSRAAYQGTVHAFRQLGYTLITSGFEDDLDRLLRLQVLSGGRAEPAPVNERTVPAGLIVLERREQI